MSSWTYIYGTVSMFPPGRGPHATKFVLEEVLAHQPLVPGSEGPMEVQIVQRPGYSGSCNHDEFGFRTNLSKDGWWRDQGEYILVLTGALRDTSYEDTLRKFSRWLDRLSKRVWIEDMLVRVSGQKRESYNWGERIFAGPYRYKENYCAAQKREGDTRMSTNWRYELRPDLSFWPDILVNLVPGGSGLAMEHDLLHGYCEPEEYLEYDYDAKTYLGPDPDILEQLRTSKQDLEDMLEILENYSPSQNHCD